MVDNGFPPLYLTCHSEHNLRFWTIWRPAVYPRVVYLVLNMYRTAPGTCLMHGRNREVLVEGDYLPLDGIGKHLKFCQVSKQPIVMLRILFL